MKIGRKQVSKFILFCLVLLPIYQDSPLSRYLGAAGYTIVMPLSLIMIVVYALCTRHVPNNEHLRRLMKLGALLLIVSFAAIIVWVLLGNPITVVSEFLPLKAIKVALQYFSFPAYIALIIITTRNAGTRAIGRYSFITLIVLSVICMIETQQSPYAFEALHFAGGFPYWRIRLLTTESSWTAVMIFCYTFLTLFWAFTYKKKVCGAIGVTCAAYLLWTTGSRTLMMATPVMVVIFIIISFRRLNTRTIAAFFVMAMAMIVFIQVYLPQLSSTFQSDIANYTSLATRLYTGILGVMIGIVFPLGVGGAVYVGVLQSALSRFMWIFDRLPIKLNTSEVVGLATSSSDAALTVKSGILQYNMYWGIIGTAYLLIGFVKISRSILNCQIKHRDIIIAAFWSSIVLVVFASNMTFEFWLMYAFLICLEDEVKRGTAYAR